MPRPHIGIPEVGPSFLLRFAQARNMKYKTPHKLLQVRSIKYEVRGTKYEVQGSKYEAQGAKYEVPSTKYGIRGAECDDIGLGGLSYATDILEGPSNGMHWQVRIPSLGFPILTIYNSIQTI